MLKQLILGSLVISGTLVIQVVFISVAMKVLAKFDHWLTHGKQTVKTTVTLIGLVLWLIAGLSLSSWLWAGVFIAVDAIPTLEAAVYFSVVTFTTLGYGDITLSEEWRILGSLAAVNGLIVMGLITAFLVEAMSRIRNAQLEVSDE